MRRDAVLMLVAALMAFALLSGCSKSSGPAGESGQLYAVLQTSMGDFKCKLFEKQAPVTVKNFTDLATGKKDWMIPGTTVYTRKPLYDGTIFHRVIPDFMIQAGDPQGNGTGGPGYRFQDEFDPSLRFDRPGLLAMANAGKNTNGSQFFITEKPTPWLTNRHTIFGECDNLDLVKAISKVDKGPGDKPRQDVTLKHVTICRGENPCKEIK